MESLFAFLGLSAVLFASTNVDDVFVLLGFFADRAYRAREVVAGQYLGIGALYGASAVASLASLVIPAAYIGLLGLAPIAIGVRKLLSRSMRRGDEEKATSHKSGGGTSGRVLSVAAVTVANGGDNISIYTPFFAGRSGSDVVVAGLVFAALTGLWCGLAYRMVRHPRLGAPIRHYAPRLVPLVLVGLGVMILYQAGSFGLLRP